MKNQEIEQIRTILTILSILGYTIVAAVVVMVGYVVIRRLKKQSEASFYPKQNEADIPPYPTAFKGFVYTLVAALGLLAYQFVEIVLDKAGYELQFSTNQFLFLWLIGDIITVTGSSYLLRENKIDAVHDWYEQHPELRLITLSVALYLIIVLPLHWLDSSRPMLDLMWLQSLLFGSLGLAWFHTFARLLMRYSYPTLDNFMRGTNDQQEPIVPNANETFQNLPAWLQLIISMVVLLVCVLIQAIISKIL